MEYHKIKFSYEQQKELIRLMVGVCFVKTKVEFDMSDWATEVINPGKGSYLTGVLKPDELYNECGTCACLMGHAAIFCKEKPHEAHTWRGYRLKLFGNNPGGVDSGFVSFLFCPSWGDSKDQAIARTYTVLTKGIPNDWTVSCEYDVPSRETVEGYAARYGVTIKDVTALAAARILI